MPIGGIEFHLASTDEWVTPENRGVADEDGLRLRGAGKDPSGYLTIMYVDIPGNSWNPQRLAKFAERANELLTYRQPIASLPDDDPDKTTDPNNYPKAYWDGTDLCSRSITISDVTFSAQTGLSFTISRAW